MKAVVFYGIGDIRVDLAMDAVGRLTRSATRLSGRNTAALGLRARCILVSMVWHKSAILRCACVSALCTGAVAQMNVAEVTGIVDDPAGGSLGCRPATTL